jgi:hypothetical protein
MPSGPSPRASEDSDEGRRTRYIRISENAVNPLLPLLVAFVVSALTAPAGVSGAFLLLPFQVSVLGFTSPATCVRVGWCGPWRGS